MKQAFQNTIESYHEFAKRHAGLPESKLKDTENNPQKLTLEGLEHWATKKFGTSKQTQEQIYALQERKLEIMSKLKQKLGTLDNQGPEIPYQADERPGHWQGDRLKTLNLITKEEEECTIGELLTDLEWGINYYLDSATPRNIAKLYYLEHAKKEISDLLDEQIIANEAGSTYNDSFKKEAYQKIHDPEHQKAGHIAEKMVRNFLKKITIDLDGQDQLAEFEILKADAYQDVNSKIDFIIKRKTRQRGVKIEASKNNLGIQFTTDQRPETIEHKGKQITKAKQHLKPGDMVDDIILVSLSMDNVLNKYYSWNQTKSAGGPDKLWDVEEKKTIFHNLMNGILTPEEIGSYLDKIS